MVVTLAVGFAANVAIFNVIDRVLLRPLHAEHGAQLAYLLRSLAGEDTVLALEPEQLAAIRGGAGVIERFEFFTRRATTWYTGSGAEWVQTLRVSPGVLDLLGMAPVLGRGLQPADANAGSPAVAMIHEDFWRRHFAASPDVLGQTILLGETPHTVVGVWPRSAVLGIGAEQQPDLVVPLPSGAETRRGFIVPIVQLARGIDGGEAARRLDSVIRSVPQALGDWRVTLTDATAFLPRNLKQGLWATYSGVSLLLLVAIANASTLLVGRNRDRSPEISLRFALGASTGRVLRLLLAEAVWLVGLGAALATPAVLWMLGGVTALTPAQITAAGVFGLDTVAAAYGAALAGLALVAIVTLAGFQAVRVRRASALVHSASARVTRWHPDRNLVVLQVAVTLVLAAGAGLTWRSVRTLSGVDPGFDLERLLTVFVRVTPQQYRSLSAREAFHRETARFLGTLPGVEAVTFVVDSPLHHGSGSQPIELQGFGPLTRAEGEPYSTRPVESGYFRTLGIPILRGRDFMPDERLRADLIIVNQAVADRYPGDIVGKHITVGPALQSTVIGVVGNVRSDGLSSDPQHLQLYYPALEFNLAFLQYVLRVQGDPGALVHAVHRRLAEIDPMVPIISVRSGRDYVREETASQRFLSSLLGAFGTLAVLLAVVGVYGMVWLSVGRRTREIGVRLALGATARRVLQDELVRACRPLVLGILVGLVGAVAGMHVLASVLFQVRPTDAWALGTAVGAVSVAGLLASVLPIRRVLRADPVAAIRREN